MRRARGGRLALPLLLAIAAGCGEGDGLGRRAATAEVTLDGRPLPAGTLMLEPASAEGGTMVGGEVRDGRFSIGRRTGPLPGPYLVRIYASSKVQSPPLPGKSDRGARPLMERIPDRYNARTTLRADVTADGTNHFRFDLTADAGEMQAP